MKKLLLLINCNKFYKPCFCSETTVAKRKIRYEFFCSEWWLSVLSVKL